MIEPSSLLSRIAYNPALRGHVGVEREYVLCDGDHPSPRSAHFLAAVNDAAWTYELSACQVEHRTDPDFELAAVRARLASAQARGERLAESLGLRLRALEVAPADMPIDVYPDARYLRIAPSLPPEVISAACRVTGVHLHVGCGSAEEALVAHNALVPHLDRLVALGDHSGGERARLYRMMAPNWRPPVYESAAHFDAVAHAQGFASTLRDCWHLIRVSRHGTVELRMFGMTADVDEIVGWIADVRDVLRSV